MKKIIVLSSGVLAVGILLGVIACSNESFEEQNLQALVTMPETSLGEEAVVFKRSLVDCLNNNKVTRSGDDEYLEQDLLEVVPVAVNYLQSSYGCTDADIAEYSRNGELNVVLIAAMLVALEENEVNPRS